MLTSTFLHVPGIGEKTERGIWRRGIHDWEAAARADLPGTLRDRVLPVLEQSQQALEDGDSGFFAERLAANQQWRMYPEFRDSVAFFDIETTGLDRYRGQITMITLYDGRRIRTYVNGENLADFAEDVRPYRLLVTYNGKQFDVPFCEAQFPGLHMAKAHIDLRYIFRALGYSGGLKGCERKLGLHRPPGLEEVDGFMAVRLWYRHLAGDPRALPALLRYNVEDVVNLQWLMEAAYNLAIEKLPIPVGALPVQPRPKVDMPFDPAVIEELAGQWV